MSERGQLQDYSVDQAAGAIVLVLGAVASLLLVIWQSRCHCKCNLCYLFQCERRPPNEQELKGLKDIAEKAKKDKEDKKDIETLPTLRSDPEKTPTPRRQSFTLEPEPEPEATSSAWKKL